MFKPDRRDWLLAAVYYRGIVLPARSNEAGGERGGKNKNYEEPRLLRFIAMRPSLCTCYAATPGDTN